QPCKSLYSPIFSGSNGGLMTPRLLTSKKWTGFPPELCSQIQSVFAESFQNIIERGELLVEGRIYPDELLFRVGFLEKGRLMQANFEVSLDFDAKRQNALQTIHFAVDTAASLMQEYFSTGEGCDPFPRQWQQIKFENKDVFIRISTENTSLEAEADRLLGIEDDRLVQGSDEESVEKAVVTMLGLGDDDDNGDNGRGETH